MRHSQASFPFLFFFLFSAVLLVLFLSFLLNIYMCKHSCTQHILVIFSQLLRCQFFKSQNKIIKKETENYYHLKLKIYEENFQDVKIQWEYFRHLFLCANSILHSAFGLFHPHCVLAFFFSAGFICAFCFLSFFLNIYYLYVHI